MEQEQEETRSSFLIKNLLRGLLWFAFILIVFLLLQDYLQSNFQQSIEAIHDKPVLLNTIFFTSEVFFGLVPPEFFMMVWILHKVPVSEYVVNLSVLTVLSYIAGIIGYWIGKNFSKMPFYKRISDKYLKQYEGYLKRYGGYLVFVGAVTPVPFSATCMMAGSVDFNFRDFLLICISRFIRFAFYGWMVWSSPNWISF